MSVVSTSRFDKWQLAGLDDHRVDCTATLLLLAATRRDTHGLIVRQGHMLHCTRLARCKLVQRSILC